MPYALHPAITAFADTTVEQRGQKMKNIRTSPESQRQNLT
jgi:hypothetical protein